MINDITLDYSNFLGEMERLENIKENIEEWVGNFIGNLVSYAEAVSKKIYENIENFIENIKLFFNDLVNEIEEIKALFILVADEVEFNLDPLGAGNGFVDLDFSGVEEEFENLTNLLDENSEEIKNICTMSVNLEEFIEDTKEALDDSLMEVIKDPIEEMKQQDDEAVFRHNESVINEMYEYLEKELSFQDEIRRLNLILGVLQEVDDFIEGVEKTVITSIQYIAHYMEGVFKGVEKGSKQMKGFLDDIMEYFKQLPELIARHADDFFYRLEKFLKGAGPVGGIDIIYMGIHGLELLNPYDKVSRYDAIKQLLGDVGSIVGNYIGGLVFGVVGAETGPFDLIIIYSGTFVGSIAGESSAENWFENHVEETEDGGVGQIHW